MRNYDHDKSFSQNLKRELKEDIENFSVNDFLYKNHRFIIELFFIGLLLLLWLDNIFIPFMEMDFEVHYTEPTIAIAIAGFVFCSLILIFIAIPFWITSWIFIIIESFYLFGLKIYGRIKK